MNIAITFASVAGIIVSFILIKILLDGLFQLSIRILSDTWFRHHTSKIMSLRKHAPIVLLVTCIVLCVLLVAVNGILIYQDKDVLDFYLDLLDSIPRQFWISLAIALFKCISLLLLIKLSLPYVLKALDRASIIAQNSDQITADNEKIQIFFSKLKKVLINGIWLLTLVICTNFLYAPDIILQSLTIALKAYLAISLGRLIIKLLLVLIDTLDALSLQYSSADNVLRYYEHFHHLIPALKKALEYSLYVAIATLVIQDIDSIAWMTAYSHEIIQIISLYFLCGVFIEISDIILEDLVFKTDHLTDLQRKRRLTIIPLFKSILKYVTYFVGGVIVLHLLGINPTPILAGAGIVGLTVGFGAQNLINDIVCGFFILFENYYLVGDYIEAGKEEERIVEGEVEAIELRTTHIRHPDGQLQIIRNGDIGPIVNYSKHYTYAKVDVPVPLGLELEQVYQLINRVSAQVQNECLDVLERTQIEGLESLDSDNLVIRTITKVKPGKHLHVPRLLRSKLKIALDQHLAQATST